jgi:hypothetical protein
MYIYTYVYTMDTGGWGHAMVNELGLAPPATFPVSTMLVSGKYIFLYTYRYVVNGKRTH